MGSRSYLSDVGQKTRPIGQKNMKMIIKFSVLKKFNINRVVIEDEKEKTAGKGFGPPPSKKITQSGLLDRINKCL